MARTGGHPYIASMDLSIAWDHLVAIVAAVPRSGLLLGTLCAIVAGVFGALAMRFTPRLGRALRIGSSLSLMGILVLVVLQLSRMDPRFEMAVPEIGLPQQVVEGGETRVPMAADGHFWIMAQVNGHPARFLVDTGATLTAVSTATAREAGLEPRPGGIPIRMQTANGAVNAELTTLAEVRFGNVAAYGIDAIIAPNIGPTNVLGMNLLSRLASWRVEGQTMILVPDHPQPVGREPSQAN